MLVSVIIPVFNSSKTIIECVSSVNNQTYKNIEIIIVNDGSTDNSYDLIMDYIKNNSINNITIINQDNSGPSSARNNGITYAKGEYIAFLDSDDEWYPCKIEKQVNYYINNIDLVLLGTRYSIGENIIKRKSIIEVTLKKLLFRNYFVTSSVMCPKYIFNKFIFNSTQKYSEDYLLWLQIATLKKKMIVLGENLTKMNAKPIFGFSGLSANIWQMEKGELMNIYNLYKSNYIKLIQCLSAGIFSLLKYCKRYALYLIFKINKYNVSA